MRWFALAIYTLIVFAFVALTAIDKQQERSCRTIPSSSLRAPPGGHVVCDDFLPW